MSDDEEPSSPVRDAVRALTYGPETTEGPEAVGRALAFKRVLVGTDGSQDAKDALAWAARIASVYDGRVEVVTAVTPKRSMDRYGILEREVLEHELQAAEGVAKRGRQWIERQGVGADAHVVEGEAGPALRERAQAAEADLLVVGSRGQGAVGRLLMGSVSDHVKNHATEHNVLVARNAPDGAAIVAAVDGSAASVRAAAVAIRLGAAWGGLVTILHVIPSTVLALSKGAQEAFEEAAAGLELPSWSGSGVRFERAHGTAAPKILDTADAQGAHLIIMGARGLGSVERHVVGSVSHSVCHHAKQSVLLMR